MSIKSIEDKLTQIYSGLEQIHYNLMLLKRDFESYSLSNSFWVDMISQKIFSEDEIAEIKVTEKAWYNLGHNMPGKMPLSKMELDLLVKYKLINSQQMAHYVPRIGEK